MMMKTGIALLPLFLSLTAVPHAANAQDPTTLRSRYPGPVTWKVGDRMDYEIDATFIGKIGTMSVEVTQDEGDAVWLKQSSVIASSPDVQEMLVDRASGKVLRYLKNGQEAAYPTDEPTIISQDDESVTVPKGTFESTHVVESTADVSRIEIWSNAQATAIDGMLKTVVGGGGDSIVLTGFTRTSR